MWQKGFIDLKPISYRQKIGRQFADKWHRPSSLRDERATKAPQVTRANLTGKGSNWCSVLHQL